jgi:hypothetical protein
MPTLVSDCRRLPEFHLLMFYSSAASKSNSPADARMGGNNGSGQARHHSVSEYDGARSNSAAGLQG